MQMVNGYETAIRVKVSWALVSTNQIRMKIYCNQHAWYLKSVKCVVQTVWIQTAWIQTEWVETKTIKEQKLTSCG